MQNTVLISLLDAAYRFSSDGGRRFRCITNANLYYRVTAPRNPPRVYTIDTGINRDTNIICIYIRIVCARRIHLRRPNLTSALGRALSFPRNCESMQITPVESSIKRLFYLKRVERGRGKSRRLIHVAKLANEPIMQHVHKTLSRIRDIYRAEIATGHVKIHSTASCVR